MRRLLPLAALVAPLMLGACASDAVLGPGRDHATMRVGVDSMTVTAIGEPVSIDAAVVNAQGEIIDRAEIAWDTDNAAGVLVADGAGKYVVMKEGTARIAAIWRKDPSVRATVTINVDAGLLGVACVVKLDQKLGTKGKRCAQQRVVVTAQGGSASPNMFNDAPLSVPLRPTTGGAP